MPSYSGAVPLRELTGFVAMNSVPAVSSKLRLWDREALARWKKLQGEQQAKLQEVSSRVRRSVVPLPQLTRSRLSLPFPLSTSQLGVPTFYRTRNESALKKQERVMSVLLGFLDDEQD